MKLTKTLIAVTLTSLLAACGGSDNDSNPQPQMGSFSLGVSDNPADATQVNIAFKQVVLKNKNSGESFPFIVTQQVDLLAFQGSSAETLVEGVQVPVGEYQMCIYMENSETVDTASSFVKTKDGIDKGLVTNSVGESCGDADIDKDKSVGRLFFNKAFTIAAGANDYVAEFDLARGIQAPHGNKDYWTLKPTSVQLVNRAEVGNISGQVSDELMAACETAAGGSEFAPAVYLYPAATLLDNMSDIRPAVTEPMVAPLAVARVNEITNAEEVVTGHDYEFGFVVTGDYALGYTCVAQNDDPEADNSPTDVEMPFFIHADEQDVTVTKGETTTRHFPGDFTPAS
ncbi:DUF4382 domain-containing protein [Shewanella litorisediminis]|uniref:DUF4382 domain-containing protein n=1 Tax=Shewanella litorisediminis TaxID=1173586 RepID=A0ABX7G4N4_9GAMM|nr:DUF4382 domain-containing protein [Shewanella litorisediminis]MCL2917764.1 DUF4382 domain-containing protein [Shewanella litorisediminis]QRH02208.1 DUF4382 domain-containing protein [Shewanella litorisediminis]